MSSRLYEGMFLFDANLAGKDWPGLEKHVDELLKKHSAEMVHSERWPDRKLAYEIRGCKKGTYYLTYFNAPAASIVGLERDCQLSDRVLRLLVLQDEALEEVLRRRLDRLAGSSEGGEGAKTPAAAEKASAGAASTEAASTEAASTEAVSAEAVSTEAVSTEAVSTEAVATKPSAEAAPEAATPDVAAEKAAEESAPTGASAEATPVDSAAADGDAEKPATE